MNKNTLITRPDNIATLRPFLAEMKITAAEKAKLDDLRAQLAKVESELAKVSNPAIKKATGKIRSGLRAGTSSGDELQDALRLAEDSRDIRRGLKSRMAELGRALAGVLEPIFGRAVPMAEKGLTELRKETGKRIAKLLPTADVNDLVVADACVAGVAAALNDLKAQAENMRSAQAEGANWKPYSATIDRMLQPLVGTLSPA
jgi:hypothetical protein